MARRGLPHLPSTPTAQATATAPEVPRLRDVPEREHEEEWRVVSKWMLDAEHGSVEHLRRQVYGMTSVRHGSGVVGLITVLEWPKDEPGAAGTSGGRPDADSLRVYLAPSRDGVNYDLSFLYAGTPLIQPGLPGEFDSACHLPASQFVTTAGEHWVYYEGCPSRHEIQKQKPCSIGLLRFRLDGMAYLAASSPGTMAWAELVSRPFVVAGGTLRLNVAVDPAAAADAEAVYDVRVALIQPEGDPREELPGFGWDDCLPVAPGINSTVRWGSVNKAAAVGAGVRMVVRFRFARLFAFQWFDE